MPATGVYQLTTISTAVSALSNRLDDSGFYRWTAVELQRYITEALQTWAAMTSRYRAVGVFNSVANQPFYDLATVLPALRAHTTTDADLVTTIEYHLLEPPTPAVWTGTPQFSLADITQAIERRRDQFLAETGAVITHSTSIIAPPPDGRIRLSDQITTVRRAAWQSTDLTVTPLLRDDVWGFNNYRPDWVQRATDTPRAYAIAEPPPLVMQVVDPPLLSGVLDLCTINIGATLDPSIGIALGVPSDWAWVIKFGALADLLSRDGLALDSARAQYCEARYQHGIDLAAKASVVWSARINNRVVPVRSLSDADVYKRSWQTGMGVPTGVLTCGQTLIGLAPVPDIPAQGSYAITLDVVRNIELPSLVNPYLQVGDEDLDVVLDYAQHLALFKEGATQLAMSQPLCDRFLRMAGVTTAFDSASTPNRAALQSQTVQDQRTTPRTSSIIPTTMTGAT